MVKTAGIQFNNNGQGKGNIFLSEGILSFFIGLTRKFPNSPVQIYGKDK
jgi:hypothetical protein